MNKDILKGKWLEIKGEIVSSFRGVITTKKNVMAIAFIARYGQGLLAKSQESEIAGREKRQILIVILILV